MLSGIARVVIVAFYNSSKAIIAVFRCMDAFHGFKPGTLARLFMFRLAEQTTTSTLRRRQLRGVPLAIYEKLSIEPLLKAECRK